MLMLRCCIKAGCFCIFCFPCLRGIKFVIW
nr:MAG TPA: hypothetical protein [Caudoviricetes sp.]